jgi:hypothetical protein
MDKQPNYHGHMPESLKKGAAKGQWSSVGGRRPMDDLAILVEHEN